MRSTAWPLLSYSAVRSNGWATSAWSPRLPSPGARRPITWSSRVHASTGIFTALSTRGWWAEWTAGSSTDVNSMGWTRWSTGTATDSRDNNRTWDSRQDSSSSSRDNSRQKPGPYGQYPSNYTTGRQGPADHSGWNAHKKKRRNA